MPFNFRDAQMTKSIALPASATTVTSASLDLQNGPRGDLVANCEVVITAPALNVARLPDTQTVAYKIEDSADNSSFASLDAGDLTQTGAGGVGAVAATLRKRLPTTCRRYVRLSITKTGAADASGVSATFELRY